MIDDNDGDTFWLAALFTPGIGGVLLLVIAIVLWLIAADNKTDCASKFCANGTTPVLLEHECRCLDKPIDTPRSGYRLPGNEPAPPQSHQSTLQQPFRLDDADVAAVK